jgi:hypothetical protein
MNSKSCQQLTYTTQLHPQQRIYRQPHFTHPHPPRKLTLTQMHFIQRLSSPRLAKQLPASTKSVKSNPYPQSPLIQSPHHQIPFCKSAQLCKDFLSYRLVNGAATYL